MHIIALAEKNAGQYRPLFEIATSFISGRGSPVSLGGDCFGNTDHCLRLLHRLFPGVGARSAWEEIASAMRTFASAKKKSLDSLIQTVSILS